MNKKSVYVIVSMFIFSILVSFIDGFVKPNYFVKIPIKIVFFLILPILFFIKNKKDFIEFKKLFLFRKKGIIKSLLTGILIYLLILFGYILLKDIIDFSNVTSSLNNGMGINSSNFIYVFVYISIFNSFLEEFFFRGYGFITLKKYTNRKIAYIFSSLIFAIYHVGMLIGMFDIFALMLILVGLIVGGIIFNYLNEKMNNIYSSWFVHMFANFAINTVGLILFGML